MQTTDVAIVGAGQAGLAMSRCLSARGIDHVLFERGAIAERWKTATWDSLRLLTPNWMNGLPWQPYEGNDPDGFMGRDELVASLEAYAGRFQAPVFAHTRVIAVRTAISGYRLTTDWGDWNARAVVIATGHCDVPRLPVEFRDLQHAVTSMHSTSYRSPEQLADGGILVVGASSSGVQIAHELRTSGREVVLAVGKHTPLPRTWRGRDIFRWLDRLGMLDQRAGDVPDIEAARQQPSLQLAGRPDRADVNLAQLQSMGVRLVGRVASIEDDRIHFADDLVRTIATAATKQERILASIDAYASVEGNVLHEVARPAMPRIPAAPTSLSTRLDGISTIIWATGFQRAFPWLDLPVLNREGEIDHEDGVTRMPGIYALGYRFLRKRDSNFIGGVGTDALAISRHVAGFLGQAGREAA